MVRRVVTEPKMGFTVVVLVASSVRFRSSMAVFKAGITPPWPFRWWKLFTMVKAH